MKQDVKSAGVSGAFINLLPINASVADALAGADEAWAQDCFSLQNEMSAFLAKRWAADAALPGELLKCRNFEDLTKVQQDWAAAALEAYANEAVRLGDLARHLSCLGLRSWFQTVKPAAAAEEDSEDAVPLVMIE